MCVRQKPATSLLCKTQVIFEKPNMAVAMLSWVFDGEKYQDIGQQCQKGAGFVEE